MMLSKTVVALVALAPFVSAEYFGAWYEHHKFRGTRNYFAGGEKECGKQYHLPLKNYMGDSYSASHIAEL